MAVSQVVLVLDVGVVDYPQDLDEAEGGPQPAQGRLLLGVDLAHANSSRDGVGTGRDRDCSNRDG